MQSLPASATESGRTRQHRAVRNVTASCIAVLLIGQLLIGILSLAALLRLGADSTADRLALMAGRTAGQIQAGLQLGKPLTQYFGLSGALGRLQTDVPGLRFAAVLLHDGTVLATVGRLEDDPTGRFASDSKRLLRELSQGAPRARDTAAGHLTLALPLSEPNGGQVGALVMQVGADLLPDSDVLQSNLRFLALITLLAAAALALTMRRLPVHRIASAGWVRLAVPLAIMLLAQGLYAVHTVKDFRQVWQTVIEQNAQLIGEGLERDLEKVLSYGIPPERLRGVEQPMSRALQAFPLLGGMQLITSEGRVLAQVGVQGNNDAFLDFALDVPGGVAPSAWLRLIPDDAAMFAAVQARALDAATIAVVAMVAAIELMFMLQVLMDRAFRASGASGERAVVDDPSRLGMVARPAMFAFLFAMALPLGFLPLYARSLIDTAVDPEWSAFLVALPTAAEMAAGLATALLAGRLIDRRGWLVPATWGMVLAVAGNLACLAAESLETLALARALAGLGYGLVWMALQGFVVNLGPSQYRGRNMTALIAGLFAGHMTGAAVGGMLASQLGYRPVFAAGAVLVVAAAVAVRVLLWPYRDATPAPAQGRISAPIPMPGDAEPASVPKRSLLRLLQDKGYVALLLGSVVPFSIAQVGLLSYALPLQFDALGASTADVGRVIMLYGFCVIYVGPLLGRATDRSLHWKRWITAGGMVGSLGLLLLQWASGTVGMAMAVVLLAMASCLAGAAQTPYMLAREQVLAYGAAGATGVMRAADKFGQMLGPLFVGGMFAAVGLSSALVWTGALYLAGTLLFWKMAPAGQRSA